MLRGKWGGYGRTFVVVMVAAVAGGCGSKSSVKTGRASGKVTFKGQPLTEGVVSFVGEQGGAGTGMIGSDGNYTLRTATGLSIPVGVYTVSVMPASPIPTDDPETAMRKAVANKGIKPPSLSSQIPVKYQSPSTSDIKKEITEGDNTINIDLQG